MEDPLALCYKGFRRLMLPLGAEAFSKGLNLFYGHGLGTPPRALRKVTNLRSSIKSRDKMLCIIISMGELVHDSSRGV